MDVLTCVFCCAEVPVCRGAAKLLEHLQVWHCVVVEEELARAVRLAAGTRTEGVTSTTCELKSRKLCSSPSSPTSPPSSSLCDLVEVQGRTSYDLTDQRLTSCAAPLDTMVESPQAGTEAPRPRAASVPSSLASAAGSDAVPYLTRRLVAGLAAGAGRHLQAREETETDNSKNLVAKLRKRKGQYKPAKKIKIENISPDEVSVAKQEDSWEVVEGVSGEGAEVEPPLAWYEAAPIRCGVCGEEVKRSSFYSEHIRAEHGIQSRADYTRVYREAGRKEWRCLACSLSSRLAWTPSAIARHLATTHHIGLEEYERRFMGVGKEVEEEVGMEEVMLAGEPVTQATEEEGSPGGDR